MVPKIIFFFGIIGTSVEEKVDLFIVDVTGIGLVIASEFTDIIFGPSIIPFPFCIAFVTGQSL